jgi:hypothetical protein
VSLQRLQALGDGLLALSGALLERLGLGRRLLGSLFGYFDLTRTTPSLGDSLSKRPGAAGIRTEARHRRSLSHAQDRAYATRAANHTIR